MSFALLAPAGLAALLALAVPLLIHLARRTVERPVDFAALRWLRPKPRPQRRPRLDERLLLAARLLLLAVLALMLARPVLRGGGEGGLWTAVVPGVDAAAARAAVGREGRARWLASGFPDLTRPAPTGVQPTASLLRDLDSSLPKDARLTVLVPSVLQSADAERPWLSRPVTWRVLPGAAPAAPAPVEPAPELTVRDVPGREVGLRHLRAAAVAWTPPGAALRFNAAPIGSPPPQGWRTLVWLAPAAPQNAVLERAAKGAVLLLSAEAGAAATGPWIPVWRDALSRPLVESGPAGRLRFTRPLTPEAMPELLEPDFPARLRALLSPRLPPPSRVEAKDYAPLVGGRAGAPVAQDLTSALALIAVALFLLERGLATRSRRAAAP